MIITKSISLKTKGNTDIVDITRQVSAIVNGSELSSGSCLVFVVGSTAALTTIEYEPGLKKDIGIFLDRIIPPDEYYHHHETWGDDNGHSHIRASLIGPDITIPFVDKKLTLGTWQQIILIDFDTRGRKRDVIVQLHGE